MNEIITTKDVHLYYGKKEALKGITLDFPQGGIHALIGPSGCGGRSRNEVPQSGLRSSRPLPFRL